MFETTDWSEYRAKVQLGSIKGIARKVCQLLARFLFINKCRIFVYRLMGMNIGNRVYIGFDCFIDPDFSELITIHDRTIVSFRVIITAHDRIRERVAPILIKRGAFIGTGAIVLPGVTIGENAVVGAGAVVARDVPDEAVVVGNPAKVINASHMNHND